jgi:hypothetical protein
MRGEKNGRPEKPTEFRRSSELRFRVMELIATSISAPRTGRALRDPSGYADASTKPLRESPSRTKAENGGIEPYRVDGPLP